jgi:hypothetical protein
MEGERCDPDLFGFTEATARTQLTHRAGGHDLMNAFLQVRAGNAGDANQRGFHVELADIENSFRIDPRFAAQPQDLFVAGALSLLHNPLPDPPYEGMEPKDSLHKHMQRSDEIIPVADVAQFVRKDGFYLWRRQTVKDAFGHQ